MSNRTTTVDPTNSSDLGQVTFESSSCTSLTNCVTFFIIISLLSNGRPGGTRTPNRQIWSLLLYQIELLTYKRPILFLYDHCACDSASNTYSTLKNQGFFSLKQLEYSYVLCIFRKPNE